MEYTRFGDTGLLVSRLAFGAMTFGEGNLPAVYKVDLAGAKALVERALAAGINFFDTADAYAGGQSEQLLGQLLREQRQNVVISTKVGMRTGEGLLQTGLSRQHILRSCEDSLRRLGTDYIDLYIVHRFDPITPLEETLSALHELVRVGKVRYLGFSNWSAWQAAKAVGIQEKNGWARFVGAQMYYSMVGRDLEHEVLPFVQDAGIGTMIWGPLAGGFLSGKYTRENLSDKDNRLSGFDFLPFDKEAGFRLLEVVRAVASAHRASVAQIALAWLLKKSGVSAVVLGASKPSQLDDNLSALDVKLSPEEMTQLDAQSPSALYYPSWFNQMLRDPLVEKALRGA